AGDTNRPQPRVVGLGERAGAGEVQGLHELAADLDLLARVGDVVVGDGGDASLDQYLGELDGPVGDGGRGGASGGGPLDDLQVGLLPPRGVERVVVHTEDHDVYAVVGRVGGRDDKGLGGVLVLAEV